VINRRITCGRLHAIPTAASAEGEFDRSYRLPGDRDDVDAVADERDGQPDPQEREVPDPQRPQDADAVDELADPAHRPSIRTGDHHSRCASIGGRERVARALCTSPWRFWFVAGMLGRNVTMARARPATDIRRA
jgi:hypothetical protein